MTTPGFRAGVSTGSVGGQVAHDADRDQDVDLRDFLSLQRCAGRAVSPGSRCGVVHDADTTLAADMAVNAADGTGLVTCMNGPAALALPPCNGGVGGATTGVGGLARLRTGDHGLHGRTVDVLSTGLVLMEFRNRWYSPNLAGGRWLQRDPLGYVDGPNVYEGFGSNAGMYWDPIGLDIRDEFSTMAQGIAAEKAVCKERGLPYNGCSCNDDRI